MVKEAQNIKISARAWELLRWAKLELTKKTYSDVVIHLDNSLENSQGKLENSLKNFDENRHRIKTKVPENTSSTVFLKPKTILLSPEARRILNRLKVESRGSAYTFSDGIEFLVTQNKEIASKIPNWLK